MANFYYENTENIIFNVKYDAVIPNPQAKMWQSPETFYFFPKRICFKLSNTFIYRNPNCLGQLVHLGNCSVRPDYFVFRHLDT